MASTDLSRLFGYSAYANRLVLNAAVALSEEDLDRSVSPSHGTVRALLQHVLESDAWFLSMCRGEAWQELPAFATLSELRDYWEGVGVEMQTFVAAQSEEALAHVVPVQFAEHRFTYTVWELLMQTFQHATHHRGELSIVMTALGHPLPTLDILLYFTDQSGQPWPFRL